MFTCLMQREVAHRMARLLMKQEELEKMKALKEKELADLKTEIAKHDKKKKKK